MARVEEIDGVLVVVADQEEELELLDHGRLAGGAIILGGAEFTVNQHLVLLPAGYSRRSARKVKTALEGAAVSHKKAQGLRRRFRVI